MNDSDCTVWVVDNAKVLIVCFVAGKKIVLGSGIWVNGALRYR